MPPVDANATRLAKVMLNGFVAFFAEFENITLGAQARYEKADWSSVQTAVNERLNLYKAKRNIV